MRSTANALSGVSLRYNVIGGFRSLLFRRALVFREVWLALWTHKFSRSLRGSQSEQVLVSCGLQGLGHSLTFVARPLRHPQWGRWWTVTLRQKAPWSRGLESSHRWWKKRIEQSWPLISVRDVAKVFSRRESCNDRRVFGPKAHLTLACLWHAISRCEGVNKWNK